MSQRTPPLILLHGFTGSPDSWSEVVSHLFDRGDRVILCPALLGHGPPQETPVADFAAEVARLHDLLDEGPYHLAGYSLGARVALGLLCRFPARFCRATLIGCHPGLRSAA